MRSRARYLMGFPLPLPDRCRGHRKRKREVNVITIVFCPPRLACRRAHGRQGQALRVAAKWRPSLTAARHGSAVELRSGGRMASPRSNIKIRLRASSCQHFMITVSEGDDRVSITICAQELRVKHRFSLHRLAYLRSGPCGVDEVYQCFLTGRFVEYLDAKLSGTGGYGRRRRTCDQQNRYDGTISTQSSGPIPSRSYSACDGPGLGRQNGARWPVGTRLLMRISRQCTRLPPAGTEASRARHGHHQLRPPCARSASVISAPFGPKPTNRPEHSPIACLIEAMH